MVLAVGSFSTTSSFQFFPVLLLLFDKSDNLLFIASLTIDSKFNNKTNNNIINNKQQRLEQLLLY